MNLSRRQNSSPSYLPRQPLSRVCSQWCLSGLPSKVDPTRHMREKNKVNPLMAAVRLEGKDMQPTVKHMAQQPTAPSRKRFLLPMRSIREASINVQTRATTLQYQLDTRRLVKGRTYARRMEKRKASAKPALWAK